MDRNQIAENEADDGTDDSYVLNSSLVNAILDAVRSGDQARLIELMEPLHPADIADLLEQIDEDDRQQLIKLYDREFDGEILSELDDSIREDVIEALRPEVLVHAVREMESDDVVDLIEDLDEPQQETILEALDDTDRIAVENSMAYPENSAGRLAQREVVSVPEHWTVGETIDYIRASEDLPEQFYHVILVNPRHEPTGYVSLGRLMGAKRETKLLDIVDDSFRTFDADEDEGDVAYAINQYHLITAPVVDENGRLVGAITIDDAMEVLEEEHEEDILRLAGVGDGSLSDRVLETAKQRFPWLAVNLATAILASAVISLFEDTISRLVALAVMMPIVASMGGNAGTQSLTVAVRSIATRDLTPANFWRVARRELSVGVINGLVFAVITGVIGYLWFDMPMLGAIIGIAMIVNLAVAALAGIGIPALLDRLGIDPALASGTFVTTVTDVVGFFVFLGLASIMLL